MAKSTAKSLTSTKYIDLLLKTDSEIMAENRTLLNETAELGLQGHCLELKKSIAKKQGELNTLKGANPYTPRPIYVKSKEIEALEAELQFMNELREEQF